MFKELSRFVPRAEIWLGHDDNRRSTAQEIINGILMKIDFLLEEVSEDLVQYPRVGDSLLAGDFKREVIEKWDSIDKDKFLEGVKYTRKVLKNVKRVIERKRRIGGGTPASSGSVGTEPKDKPDGKAKGGKRCGRPKVTSDEIERRRELKSEWERYRDSDPEARKKRFCEDEEITVKYLNNSVLRWCRDNPT